MYPLLITSAVSLAGDLLHAATSKSQNADSQKTPAGAKAADFPAMLDRATASPAARLTATTSYCEALKSRLCKSGVVAAAINESGGVGPFQLHFAPDGSATLQGAGGLSKGVEFGGELRAAVQELFTLSHAQMPQGSATRGVTVQLNME